MLVGWQAGENIDKKWKQIQPKQSQTAKKY